MPGIVCSPPRSWNFQYPDIVKSEHTFIEVWISPDHTQFRRADDEDDMRAAGLLMQQHKIGSLPVMDGDKLVGIITDSDYVSLAMNLLEQLDETNPLDNDDFDELDNVGGFKPDDQES